MPSARDLMQKADSLMRSNRSGGVSESDQNIPVLTDVVIRGEPTVLRAPQTVNQAFAEPAINLPVADEVTGDINARATLRSMSMAETEKRALAETVYFEVLRDLDIESPEGMRGRLSLQMVPVFDKISRELVDRLQHILAEAIRDQVAAAIERKLGVPPAPAESLQRREDG